MQSCFRGDGKTLMMVNLSPTEASASESLCSLRFAAQVSQVELGKAKRKVADFGTGAEGDADIVMEPTPAAGYGSGRGGAGGNSRATDDEASVDEDTSAALMEDDLCLDEMEESSDMLALPLSGEARVGLAGTKRSAAVALQTAIASVATAAKRPATSSTVAAIGSSTGVSGMKGKLSAAAPLPSSATPIAGSVPVRRGSAAPLSTAPNKSLLAGAKPLASKAKTLR